MSSIFSLNSKLNVLNKSKFAEDFTPTLFRIISRKTANNRLMEQKSHKHHKTDSQYPDLHKHFHLLKVISVSLPGGKISLVSAAPVAGPAENAFSVYLFDGWKRFVELRFSVAVLPRRENSTTQTVLLYRGRKAFILNSNPLFLRRVVHCAHTRLCDFV